MSLMTVERRPVTPSGISEQAQPPEGQNDLDKMGINYLRILYAPERLGRRIGKALAQRIPFRRPHAPQPPSTKA
jgi:hypothetical protein